MPAAAAPTLMIVGEQDREILEINRQAQALLRGPKELVVISGATHLFTEPGAIEEVARLATQWFNRHLHPAAHTPAGDRHEGASGSS